MATAYLVTSGEYSDYGVNAVFTSRELAEAWIAAKKLNDGLRLREDDTPEPGWSTDDDYRIEEYELDVAPEPVAPEWYAEATIEGGGLLMPPVYTRPVLVFDKPTDRPAIRPGVRGHCVYGFGPTREHAARAVREVVRAVLAGQVPLPPLEPRYQHVSAAFVPSVSATFVPPTTTTEET